MEAAVLKVLGDPDDPRTEVEKVLAIADVDEGFPDDVERIAAGIGEALSDRDCDDRTDLRHIPFTTIDPETARDFDDAVAIEKLPHGGSRLWVAVADVSHYVREGSPIDVEARRRGCSIYLPNRAIPMLPEPLSARMCSLVPNEDRLAMVVRIDIDRQGNIGPRDYCAAVIHSQARLDYPGVAAALGGDTRGKRKKYEPFLPALRAMDSLARQLRVARLARGALDFDLPEPFVELDHDDPRLVRAIRKSRRDPGERQAYSMIEEFMLAANEAVASSFQERGEDALWRIHDAPDRSAAGRVRDAGRALRHRDRRRRGAHAQGAQAGAGPPEGSPGREAAVVPVAAVAEAGDLRRREHRALRARFGRLPALHLTHSPLPGPGRAPPVEGAARRR